MHMCMHMHLGGFFVYFDRKSAICGVLAYFIWGSLVQQSFTASAGLKTSVAENPICSVAGFPFAVRTLPRTCISPW